MTHSTSSPRSIWLQALETLSRPLLEHFAAGDLFQTLPSEKHAECQEGRWVSIQLEAVGRLLAGIAPWLDATNTTGEERALQQEFTSLIHQGLSHALNPEDPDSLACIGYQQPIVDTAFLAQAVLRAPKKLWAELTEERKSQLVTFLSLQDPQKPYFNNWLLFSACIEAAKHLTGSAWDPMRVDYALRQHEQWYLGDGHYGDGPEFHADYYNSFVIQPMMLDILEELPEIDPFWDAQRPLVQQRLSRYAEVQERFIHPDGTWPVLGRSICYRAGAFHALSTAAWKNLLPETLAAASVRCALTAVITKGFPSSMYTEEGWPRIGLSGSQPSLGERYITTGSLYLSSFVFPALGLSPEDPFWSTPDEPWTSVRVWEHQEDIPADHALRTAERLI